MNWTTSNGSSCSKRTGLDAATGGGHVQSTFGDDILIYTTRPDTLFGATYLVLSPEHPLLEQWMDRIENADAVKAYQAAAAAKSDLERTELNKKKTGVRLCGVQGVNPVNGKQIPHFHLRLCPGHLRHRRHYGGTGSR